MKMDGNGRTFFGMYRYIGGDIDEISENRYEVGKVYKVLKTGPRAFYPYDVVNMTYLAAADLDKCFEPEHKPFNDALDALLEEK